MTSIFTQKLLQEQIKTACRSLESLDNELWQYNLNERTFAHRLAVYLEEGFSKGISVDCEYNRQGVGGDQKQTSYTDNGIYVDVIAHERGSNERNLVHIELKRSDNPKNRESDHLRLSDLKKPPKNYLCSCFVLIDMETEKLIESFL